MLIRSLCKYDIKNNYDLLAKFLKNNHDISYPNDSQNNCHDQVDRIMEFINDGSAIIYGAFENDNLKGFIWAYKRYFFNEYRLHITELYVSDDCRSMGIGSKLISAVEEKAKTLNIKKLDLMVSSNNLCAQKFYEKNSFNVQSLLLVKKI